MVRRRTRTRKKPAGPARRNSAWVLAILGGLVVVNLYVFVWDKKTSLAAISDLAQNPPAMQINRPLENLDPPQPSGVREGAAVTAGGSGAAAATHAEGKVAKSDTLGRLLRRSGLDARDTDEVIRAVAAVFDVREIRPGEAFRVERGSDGRVTRFELDLGRTGHLRAVRDTGGALVATVAER
jgi:hypothetical protein